MIAVACSTEPVGSCDSCGSSTHRVLPPASAELEPRYEPTGLRLYDVMLQRDDGQAGPVRILRSCRSCLADGGMVMLTARAVPMEAAHA